MMKKRIFFAISIFFLNTPLADACTRLFMNQGDIKIVGRTFDWETHYDETLKVLPRGRVHRGESPTNEAIWHSKYGSIVIQENHDDQRAITDGVNEKGLAAHLLAFKDGEYPAGLPQKSSVSIFQWVQYYLDNFATVQEVVDHLDEIQIVPADFADYKALPLHVALDDQSGDSAIIEFIKGELKCHHNKAFTTMTNEPDYDTLWRLWTVYEKNQCNKDLIPLDDESESRFIRASCYLRGLPQSKNSDMAVAYISSIMENVSIPYGMSPSEATWWRTFIDFSRKRYYFKSTLVPTLFWLDYGQIDFSHHQAYREIKVHDAIWEGDITSHAQALKQSFAVYDRLQYKYKLQAPQIR